MSVLRRVFATVLTVAAVFALAACNGDGGDGDFLAPGEYQFNVSGTLDLEFPAESASALPTGTRQAQDTDISGDVKLKMNKDGSFEFEGWGIKAKVKEGSGATADLDLHDSPKEPSTGKTDKDGTEVDIYLEGTVTNQETRSGTNDATISGSSPDPLAPNIDNIEIDVDNPPTAFADRDGNLLFIVNGGKLILARDLEGGQTPQAQPTTPAPQPTTPAPQPTTPSPQVEAVRVEQKPGCQHPATPEPTSDLLDLILLYLKKNFPATPQPGNYRIPDSPPRLVIAVPSGPGLSGLGAPALGGDEEPLAGVKVFGTISGPGILDPNISGTTDENGRLRVEAGINKFGDYTLVVSTVQAPDGKLYAFDPASETSVKFTVGPTCEPPEGW